MIRLFHPLFHVLREAVIDPESSLPIGRIVEIYNGFVSDKSTSTRDKVIKLNDELNQYRIFFGNENMFKLIADKADLGWTPGHSFAYTHPKNGDIAFINMLPPLNAFRKILRHELVHREQISRIPKGKEVNPNITDADSYLHNKQELMAWARSSVDDLAGRFRGNKDMMKAALRNNSAQEITRRVKGLRAPERKLFLKYVYAYIDKE